MRRCQLQYDGTVVDVIDTILRSGRGIEIDHGRIDGIVDAVAHLFAAVIGYELEQVGSGERSLNAYPQRVIVL